MPPLRRSLLRPFAAVVSAGVALSGMTLFNGSATAAATHSALHVDFGTPASTAPHGYVLDYGRAWSASRGYGWIKAGTTKPLSLVANTAKRSSKVSPDRRYDSLIQMQAAAGHGTTTVGQWQATLANGVYSVTVGVGDATKTDSVDRVTAQPSNKSQVVLVGNFKPSKGHHFYTVTKKVRVSNGLLVLSPTGGRNTKLDYVVAMPVTPTKPIVTPTTAPSTPVLTPPAADATAPQATVVLIGTQVAAATYTGTVIATINAADEAGGSGLRSVTYSLDGAASQAYTAPIAVAAAGNHLLKATATDNTGNVKTVTSSWSQQSVVVPLPDTTAPTVSVALSGSGSGSVYTGTVTVTVTAADNPGGSGIGSVTYSLDSGTDLAYTVPLQVTTPGAHSVVVTATDNQGNVAHATASWSIQTNDTTAPTASIALAGTLTSPSNYSGPVTATVTAADEAGGSGLKSTTYSIDGGSQSAYTSPVTVVAAGHHTFAVTVKDNAGNTGTASTSWNQTATSGSALVVVSPDDAIDANPTTPRLVFSSVHTLADPAAKAFTFSNTGSVALTVSNLAIGGTNASSWTLATGQATSITLQPGQSQQVSIQFSPTDPAGCAGTASPYAIGDVDRFATLTYSTDDPSMPTGFDVLSGVNSCYVGGNNEPVLDQLLPALGYTTVVDTQYIDRRYIGPLRWLQGTDEIQSPYFTAADSSQPVSLTPIAHYGSANSVAYQATGWYAQGSAMTLPRSTCSSACKTLWQFPADTISGGVTTYNQNQKLLPSVTGATTFTPTGNFGLFSGDFSDVNFSDDGLNVGHDKSNNPLTFPHYLHDMRVYPAYGPGHVAIPNTYIVGIDLSRVPAYKNNDFQDIVLLLRNAQPAVVQATVVNATNDISDLTTGGSVSPSCGVTGFDGIMANTAGTQCNAGNMSFSSNGLTLTSTPGQLASGTQQNAIYKSFDASQKAFTVTARVLGPVTSLTTDYQQIAAFFGPDQKNFLKVEAEHNGSGDPHLTMFYDVNGVSSTIATVAAPALTTATTVDLIIKGNTNQPDPAPYGDADGVHGFPRDVLTVSYSINGDTPVQIGTISESPADVTGWFSRSAKAGILVANPGAGAPSLSATFSKFSVTTP